LLNVIFYPIKQKADGMNHPLFVSLPAADFTALYTASGKNRLPIFACKMARMDEAYSVRLRSSA
jgi:hypothetical protein